LEPISFGLLSEFLLHPLVVLDFLSSEDGLVIGLAGVDQVEQDSCAARARDRLPLSTSQMKSN